MKTKEEYFKDAREGYQATKENTTEIVSFYDETDYILDLKRRIKEALLLAQEQNDLLYELLIRTKTKGV